MHWLALALVLAPQGPGHPPFKNPPNKADEIRRFHTPEVRGMPAALRMKGYEQRLQMEAESPFGNVRWRNVGPELQGGRVVDIEAPAGNLGQLLVAYATGGLWRTEDEGITWTPLFDNESAFAIGDFAVSRDGNTIWVGTGENNGQRTSYSGTGVFKSTDAGKTWQNMGLADTHRIGRVLIDPKNENHVWVGAIGALYSQGQDRGVYKTEDGGKTWRHALKLDDFTGVIDLAMDPKNPQVVYAATWERDRRAWNFREGGPGTGIYKTSDGGKTWARLGNGLPKGDVGRIGIAVAPSKPNVVYAFIDNQNPDPDTLYRDENTPGGQLTPRRFKRMSVEQFLAVDRAVLGRFAARYLPNDTKLDDVLAQLKDGKMTLEAVGDLMVKRTPNVFTNALLEAEVYRSDDAGKTWRKAHFGLIGDHGGYYCGRVIVNPRDENDLVITGVILLRSRDGGKTWSQMAREVHVDHHAHWYDPRNPARQFNGNDGGLYVSANDGKNWLHLNSVPVGQFTTIAVDNKIPYNIIGGLQDNGTLMGPSNWTPPRSLQATTYSRPGWKSIGWGDGSAIAVDWKDDDIVYTASQFGNHSGWNQKTNERWQLRPRPQPGEPPLRFNWISPIQISTHHPDIIYLGSQKLHRSLDKGRTWEDLSGDLTKNLPNGDVPFSTLKDLSESPFKFGLIYVGADDGTVKMTRNHGATWEDISTPAKDRWVTRVVASKWDRGTVYVAQNGYRQDDFAPYLWKSTDYGKTWTSIVGNLPTEQINVIREDPRRKDLLYVGTGLGVYVSYDGGKVWETLHGGIPRTPVHDLVVHPRDDEMVIASHARSVWVLDLKPVYNATEDLRKADLKVTQSPGTWTRGNIEYRTRQEWDTSNPEPPKVRGEFWAGKPGKALVEVKDKDGNVVKSVAIDAIKGYNPFEFDTQTKPAARWTVNPKNVPIKTVEDALKDPYEAERPRYLPAGEYKVSITLGGKTETVDWRIAE